MFKALFRRAGESPPPLPLLGIVVRRKGSGTGGVKALQRGGLLVKGATAEVSLETLVGKHLLLSVAILTRVWESLVTVAWIHVRGCVSMRKRLHAIDCVWRSSIGSHVGPESSVNVRIVLFVPGYLNFLQVSLTAEGGGRRRLRRVVVEGDILHQVVLVSSTDGAELL